MNAVRAALLTAGKANRVVIGDVIPGVPGVEYA